MLLLQDAAKIAKDSKVTIFTADIIYHLFDKFTQHMAETKASARKNLTSKGVAVFPVQLKIMPLHIFNKRNPVCDSKYIKKKHKTSAGAHMHMHMHKNI